MQYIEENKYHIEKYLLKLDIIKDWKNNKKFW